MNKPLPWTRLLVCLSTLFFLSVACSPTPKPETASPTPANAITNITWQWTSVTNRSSGETTQVSAPQNYTLTFREDGTLSGKADCNTFNGTYSQQGGISITIGASTKAYCGDSSLDQQYLQLLSEVTAGGPDGQGNLALETPGGEQRMLFANGGAASAP